MKKILNNQYGVTLIETVAATAIIMIILITILGALLYGQKMIVFSDSKNNEAAQAQELVDTMMAMVTDGILPTEENTGAYDAGKNADGNFVYKDTDNNTHPKQYIIEMVPIEKTIEKGTTDEKVVNFSSYNIKVRSYYNNGESYVDLNAYVKEDGIFK